MYKVVKYFTDLHDDAHPYNVGDVFPRDGLTVSEERFAELAGFNNAQGVPLIEQVKEKEAEKPKQRTTRKKVAE